jgi:ATP-dependent Clp protease protease subunit
MSERIIIFSGEINEPTTTAFIQKLLEATEKFKDTLDRQLVICISSDGGRVTEGFRMFDWIRQVRSDFDISIIAEGFVASAATFVLCAVPPERRFARPSTFFLVHSVSQFYGGTLKDCAANLEFANALEEKVLNIYKESTLIDRELYEKESYFDVNEALRLNLVSRILP